MPTTARRLWCWAAGAWSVLFAASHFYWVAGGRAGLGSQAAAADAALEQTWFAAYNLAAGGLGVLGDAGRAVRRGHTSTTGILIRGTWNRMGCLSR